MRLDAGDRELEGITVLAQNSDPFTYFGEPAGPRLPTDVAIDDGTLAIAVLRRAAQRDMPTIVIARLLAERFRAAEHRQIDHFDGVTEGASSRSPRRGRRARPLPGPGRRRLHRRLHARLELGIEPGALTVVA